jgi:hypothetical protein
MRMRDFLSACCGALLLFSGCSEPAPLADGHDHPDVCADLTGLKHQNATVVVGDSVQYSIHPRFSAECVNNTHRLIWGVQDSTIAGLGIATDTSVHVTGLAVGQTVLVVRAAIDPNSGAVASLTVVSHQQWSRPRRTGSRSLRATRDEVEPGHTVTLEADGVRRSATIHVRPAVVLPRR